MTAATRRTGVLTGLTVAAVVSASIPASAAFSDSVTVPQTVDTLTVAAPAGVSVNSSCSTATTVVKRTVYTNPYTGAQTQIAYSSTTTYAASASNVQGTTTSTVSGPGWNETTTTTTTKNTNVTVTASWPASGTRGVSGYRVNAYLGGTVYPMIQTSAGTLSTSQTVDADNLAYQPRLSVTTLTSYGWTAESGKTGVITC